MAMFTSESASSLLKAEETSSASSLPRNLAIQGYGTPRWKRYEKVKFHASYHILPYLTISYHSFCTFSRIWTFLLGVAIPRDQIKSNQCHESCQLIWWFWEYRIHVFDDSGGFQVGNFFLPTGIQVLLRLGLSRMAPGQVDIFEEKTAWINVVTKTVLY